MPLLESRSPSFPHGVAAAIGRLRAAGLEVLAVGGALRDALLARAVRDFDLLVPAGLEGAARVLPEAIAVSRHHPVLLLPATADCPRIEIAGLRAGARDVEEDLRARDFSVNAIAFDTGRSLWLDPTGGLTDLAARRLRAAEPERALRDDPLRILRGARLELELSFELEPATLQAMERHSPRLARVPGERLREELFRLLVLPDPTRALERLRRLGALAAVLPELLRGVGVTQNRHHADDVYRHSVRVCALAAPRPLLRLAALLHDAAKPETKALGHGGDFHFLRHERLAAPHVERAAARLRLSRHEEEVVGRMVRHHLIFPEQLAKPAALRRFVLRTGLDLVDDLLELRRADLASRGQDGPEWEAFVGRVRALVERARAELPAGVALSGEVVMKELGLAPGTVVGRWLRRARQHVLAHPEENTPQRLVEWLHRRARGKEV